MTEQEIIQAAKTNWLAWQGLNELQPEVAAWMEGHKSDCVWRDHDCNTRGPVARWLVGYVYRLRPDYEPEPKSTHGWREYAVVEHNGIYCIKGYGNMKGESTMRLSHAIDRVGFGGVQFEGCDLWSMQIACYINDDGTIDLFDNRGIEAKPATPIKARFWEAL